MPIPRLRPSFTLTDDRLAELRAVVPEAFADGAVNWEALAAALGDWLEDEGRDAEHFGLNWPGKREAARLAARPAPGALHPAPGQGVHEATTRHVFIEGDNLAALKLLLTSYAGQVKLVYIDPPYNTGNAFVYRDDFSEPLADYLRRSGQADEPGRAPTPHTRADGRFHSAWLSMMYPRLLLARQLLRDDGVIFVSIDDNEAHHLRLLLDEVFGEENFIANIAWEKRFTRSNNAKLFYSLKDTILLYRKTPVVAVLREPRTDKANSIYKNPDNDPRGPWTSSSYVNPATRAQRPNLVYPIVNPHTGERINHPTHAWKYEPAEHARHARENRLWWGHKGAAKYPRLKVFLSEAAGGLVPVDVWDYKTSGTTDEGGAEVKALFNAAVFDNPKPTKLIKRMLRLGATGRSDLVLDFFAGSATTAQAVLELNREDGGHRRFLLVQAPDPTPPASTAYKAGYTTIAEISKERIRRVIRRLAEETAGPLDLSERETPEDLGFRVYRLGRSSFRAWQDDAATSGGPAQGAPDPVEDALAPGWTAEGLLTEVLLTEGFPLGSRVTPQPSFLHNRVLLVESEAVGHRLWVCLDTSVHPATAAALQPGRDDTVILLDSALADLDKLRLADRLALKTV